MATRRMFSKNITDTDLFLDMPGDSQILYFHLNMHADDEGFVSSPKKVMRIVGSSGDSYKILIAKRFIFEFENGVCVIKDWKIHNYIQKDRYTPSLYINEKQQLSEDENKAYTRCIHDVDKVVAQVRIGKVRKEIGKVSIDIGKGKQAKTNTYKKIDLTNIHECLTLEQAKELIDHRIHVKKPMSQKAFKLLSGSIFKCVSKGFDSQTCIDTMIEKGWQSINYEWLLNSNKSNKKVSEINKPFQSGYGYGEEMEEPSWVND